MMIDFKQARLDNAYHTDSITDAAGYASCAARIDEKLKDIGYEEGIKVFDHITIAGMIDMLTKLEIKGLVDCGG